MKLHQDKTVPELIEIAGVENDFDSCQNLPEMRLRTRKLSTNKESKPKKKKKKLTEEDVEK